MSVFTLREAVKKMQLPVYTPPGKGYLFFREDLEEWLGRFRNPSREELEGDANVPVLSPSELFTQHDRLSQKQI